MYSQDGLFIKKMPHLKKIIDFISKKTDYCDYFHRAKKRPQLMSKPRVVKDYDKLDITIQEQIKLHYNRGFEKHLIKFKNKEGKFVSALPFETDEKYYLVRMTQNEAQEIIEEDDDYNADGILKEAAKIEYENKYDDEDDDLSDEDEYDDEKHFREDGEDSEGDEDD